MSVDFYDEDAPSGTFKSRQSFIDKYSNIAKKYAYRNGEPETSVSEIFEKTSKEAAGEDINVSQSAKEDSSSTGTGSSEGNALLNNLYTMAGTQFVQMFYDLYMSPLNSDMEYRLGKVTGTKVNFQNIGKFKKESDFNGAQFDKFGRIDSTVNFKMKTHIDGFDDGSIRGYDEYFVNWFFPPYNQSAFKVNGSIADLAKKDLTQRVWNDAHQCWEINGEKDETTYDIQKMMSCRTNPTYRSTAFKAVNDNIQWLQHIYENTTGIVSTYLTEWDLSLYIQEGLIEDAKKYPVINMCYRILEDNPMGWKDARAFNFGLLNASMSNTPTYGIIPNTLEWNPANYPLSAYWTSYESFDRGDGLDIFYNVAEIGHNGTGLQSYGYSEDTYSKLNIKDRIRFYDDIGAAYAGWDNYEGMKTWQTLFTSEESGLNELDLAHITETIRQNKDGLTLRDAIGAVTDAKYSMDDSLGYNNDLEGKVIEEAKPKKLLGLRNRWVYYKKNWITGDYEECGARVTPRWSKTLLYWQKPVKGLIFTPKWIPSILPLPFPPFILPYKPFSGRVKNAMDMGAIKSMYGDVDPENLSASGGTIGNNAERSANGYSKVPESSAGSFADHFGIPQKTPALYGGPHGKYYSPKTIQAYFEEENPFLKNVPRVDKTQDKSHIYSNHFVGSNGFYSYYCEEDVSVNPSRSPSYGIKLLEKGTGTKDTFFSNIKAFWEINKVRINTTTHTRKSNIYAWFASIFTPWASRYSVSVNSTDSYRLVISGGQTSKVRVTAKTASGYNTTTQNYSQNEKDFVKNVFGISDYGTRKKSKNTSDWKKVYLFQANSETERFTDGPNLIFEVPCRVNSYKYQEARWSPFSWFHFLFGWTGLFSWWGESFTDYYAEYIEVDCDHVKAQHSKEFWSIWPCIKDSTPAYSNIGTDTDPAKDIPSDSFRTVVASTPWVFEQNTSMSSYAFIQDFLGQDKNYYEKSIFGWGYTTAFQSISPENQDSLFTLSGQNGKEAKDTPIKDLVFKFNGVNGLEDADQALNNSLKKLVTTSTFYKYTSDENLYAMPCIIQNDVPFRVAIKIALHQKAWLEQAKESFIENIDFSEVQNVLNTSVEPAILSASTSGKIEDVHYSDWIKKATDYFGEDKSIWEEKFNTLITSYKNFIEKFKDISGKSATEWTFNDFNSVYGYLDTIGNTSDETSDFMTSYLHVLYEYRKYFINKRFNKAGGTMTSMKHLEGAVPLMLNTKKAPENKSLSSVDTLPSNFESKEMDVSMYEVSNPNSQKLKAATSKISSLSPDKTKTLYIKVEYAEQEEIDEYISDLRAGKYTKKLMYIPKNDKWAKLPENGVYQFISKEWEKNDKNRVWNLTCNPGAERVLNPDITNCIFNITWCNESEDVAYKVLSSVDTSLDGEKERYSFKIPFVYTGDVSDICPLIKFGLTSGLNTSKLIDVASLTNISEVGPLDLVCTSRKVDDFWKIEIPFSEQPLTTGYKTKLKLKTYLESPVSSVAQETLAGPMTFTIWPITEDQVDVTPGIGVNMTKQAEELRENRTSIDMGGI